MDGEMESANRLNLNKKNKKMFDLRHNAQIVF